MTIHRMRENTMFSAHSTLLNDTQEDTGKQKRNSSCGSRGFRAFRGLLRSDLLINSGMVFSASFFGALFMFVPALVDFGASPTLTKYIAEFLARGEKSKINHLVRVFFSVKVIASFVVGGLAYLFRSEIAVVFLKDVSLAYFVLPGVVLALFSAFELSKPVVTGFQKFKLLSASNVCRYAKFAAGKFGWSVVKSHICCYVLI